MMKSVSYLEVVLFFFILVGGICATLSLFDIEVGDEKYLQLGSIVGYLAFIIFFIRYWLKLGKACLSYPFNPGTAKPVGAAI